MLEPIQDLVKKNIAAAKCLVKVKKGKACLRLLNPSESAVHIHRDMVLAKVSDVHSNSISVLEDKSKTVRPPSQENQSDKEKPLIEFDLSGSDLNDEQKQTLRDLVLKNRDSFFLGIHDLGKTDAFSHRIDTEDVRPIRQAPYRTTPQTKENIDNQLDQLLEKDMITPSSSAWTSPIVMVKKKSGEYRMAIDYRKLNSVTKPISYPLPRLEEIFETLGDRKAKIFSTLDLASGFWEVPMDESTKEKAAFVCHRGVFEWNVMPFGLSGAPITFQMMMTQVLREMNWRYVLVYVDDVLVFSRSFEEHLDHLQTVFDKIREAKLTLKPEKCKFAVPKVKYLGHIISKNGVEVDPEKIEAVKSFPRPKKVKEVRSFLGLCNYYRKFVEGYSKLTSPLTKLLRKDAIFQWTDSCQKAFDSLKDALSSAPVLIFPDMNKGFTLTTDASNIAIGYVLSQEDSDGKDHPIAFGGRSLSRSEEHWSTSEKECLAVIEGCRKYDSYILHQHFTIYTDHKALTWLQTAKHNSSRLNRWALELQAFKPNILYKKGSSNGAADALSRRPYDTTSDEPISDGDNIPTPPIATVIVDNTCELKPGEPGETTLYYARCCATIH